MSHSIQIREIRDKQDQMMEMLASFISAQSPVDAAEAMEEELPEPCSSREALMTLEVKLRDTSFKQKMVSVIT